MIYFIRNNLQQVLNVRLLGAGKKIEPPGLYDGEKKSPTEATAPGRKVVTFSLKGIFTGGKIGHFIPPDFKRF